MLYGKARTPIGVCDICIVLINLGDKIHFRLTVITVYQDEKIIENKAIVIIELK